MEYRIDDLILELHSIHNQLNKILFDNSLQPIKINIETSIRKNRLTLGHFSTSKDWSDKRNQITIWTLALNGDYLKIIGVLLHEMIHQFNFENNLKDTENNQRHNKNFRNTAINIAKLKIKSRDVRLGFAYTELSEELIWLINNRIDFNINVFKKLIHKDAIEHTPKGYNKSKKYICKGCNTIINNTREKELNIKCLDCNLNFKIFN
ncbi:SprT-like domain-containing protein [Spiroplasma taiwanense]|uniref:SprT-like domain-containing protein n=1 Tax=Spiroplasma taiwanense CT-1 TaxID=1276220 RepID=S5LU17_9MOLU|nr:SprT-like domain-containing protein [Spiroplasma taiwanense]AGR41219.1 hypothetical protein STAIW_v1c05970 [Spiroplasma taiwanense CT-1]